MNKNKSIKKSLPHLAILMILLFLVIIIPMNIWLQVFLQHNNQQESTLESFMQLEQLIINNNKTIEETKLNFKNRCIRSADVVAFTISKDKSLIYNLEELSDLAEKLQIDEIHYFSKEGKIISGTHPEYYGFSFDSGEQMNFFKPMLYDSNLKLCQDITPNTAENKNMQYAAVWLEDGSGIVQIGMKPIRLEQEVKERSIENTVSQLTVDINGYLHIVDNNANKIVASSNKEMLGLNVSDYHNDKESSQEINQFHDYFNGVKYCVYTRVFDNYTFIRTYVSKTVVENTIKSSLLSIIYVLIGTFFIILAIRWYIQNKIIKNFEDLNNELNKIDDGDAANINLNTGISEIESLVFYINQMLNNIRLNWNKLSYIMDKVGIPVGIAEKNKFYKKLLINNRLLDILDIDINQYKSNEISSVAENILKEIKNNAIDKLENIYKCEINGNIKYLRIETMADEQSVIDYVTDVSLWWNKLNTAKEQSEMDILTGLYNRRGFYNALDNMFVNPKLLNNAAIIMIDADNLKIINDSLGHYIGDNYLISLANELEQSVGKNGVCARLGGDEFAIFVFGQESSNALEMIINQIKLIRNKKTNTAESDDICTLQFSMGVAYYLIDGNNYHDLLRQADKSMYIDKKNRKGM